jgi:hypothetical protein
MNVGVVLDVGLINIQVESKECARPMNTCQARCQCTVVCSVIVISFSCQHIDMLLESKNISNLLIYIKTHERIDV